MRITYLFILFIFIASCSDEENKKFKVNADVIAKASEEQERNLTSGIKRITGCEITQLYSQKIKEKAGYLVSGLINCPNASAKDIVGLWYTTEKTGSMWIGALNSAAEQSTMWPVPDESNTYYSPDEKRNMVEFMTQKLYLSKK